MNEVQRFLYAQTSRVLESKEKTKCIIFSNEVTGSTFLNRSVYINRFDDSFKTSDIQAENYSSSCFCDVQQDAFWDFLYSDLWNGKFVLRVLSGELFTALDCCLNEMLEAGDISRHVTVARLRVKSKEGKEKLMFDLSPEMVQVEFTYYRRNNSKEPSISANSSPLDTGIENSTNLGLESECSFNISNKSLCAKLSHVESQRDFGSNLDLSASNLSNLHKNVINIILGHFPCVHSRDIENDPESEYSLLENEIQRGNWIKNKPTAKGSSWRSCLKTAMLAGVLNAPEKTNVKRTKSSKKMASFHENVEVPEVDTEEDLLMPISIDIDLTNLGKIMERERFLKFKKMTTNERKKFFLSDERLQRAQKWKAEIPEEGNLESLQPTRQISSKKQDKITNIENMKEFATFVLGISESPSIYRALIWLGKCDDEKETESSKTDITLKHANFGAGDDDDDDDDDDADVGSLEVDTKLSLFKSRNRRNLMRTFTYHPKVFMPQQIAPVFETKRLRRSYSPDSYERSFSWEKGKSTHRQLQLSNKTKVIIPEFGTNKQKIDPEMILKALGDFIVRKEHVLSSKGISQTSIVFIRPVCLNKLFF